MAAVYKSARICRKSLDKAFFLQGKTGHIFFDLWVYLTVLGPWIVPILVVIPAGLFASLVSFVSKLLSEDIMIEKTVTEAVTVPFMKFFEKTITVEKTIMVPDIEQPDILVSQGIAIAILVGSFILLSYILKWIFVWELRYKRGLLLRSIKKERASKYRAIKQRRRGSTQLDGAKSASSGQSTSPAASS